MRVTSEYNRGKLYPDLGKEWHPTKNEKLRKSGGDVVKDMNGKPLCIIEREEQVALTVLEKEIGILRNWLI